MKTIKFWRFLGMALLLGFFMASCGDTDSVLEEEKEVMAENTAELNINNRTINSNAYAMYCNANGKEYLMISNKQELLFTLNVSIFTLPTINTDDFLENDFVFISANDPGVIGSFEIGGSVFGPSTLGGTLTQNTFDSGTTSNIVSNDGSIVIGSMSGNFEVLDPNGVFFLTPYNVNFTADIVETSTFCD